MKIAESTAFVTGANRGLGRRFAEQLVARGAIVYGGVRNPASLDVPGVIPITIDVTDPASVAAAAKETSGVSLLINNAGSYTGASVSDGSLSDIRLEMETHYFGTLAVSRAFAPQLADNGGGTILNVLSVLSWVTYPGYSGYAAAKAAQWSLTNALRLELAAQGTSVAALHVGFLDTDMVASVDAPKNDPAVVAALSLDALEEGTVEILADEDSRQVQSNLAGGVPRLYSNAG
ncbi:short-subunit dehydrogenase [Nonomuraea fuscirosea]|uniref:Short-subunit dehydrogenase n=1 Tax=Nonomuraea fuscirosea TaxID=1291556 RepID=A0A2T0LXM5_9ACTN|nr:SDR family oxidoreductase [Nonomuraea fuscirosea]PRX48775.1 short-subunit dehydrogenase [Nonomuraea fuscirosea]